MELCAGAKYLNARPDDSALDSALVEKCRRQDREAFSKVVDAYQHRVYGFVRRMVYDPEEAADLAQEVFVRAYQAFARFDGRSSLRTWLFRIAYNLCIDRARKLDRTPAEIRMDAQSEDELPLELPDSRWDPEEIVMTDELVLVIEGALATMSEKLKTVLLLHDREDLAYDQIAATVGVPVGTVKSRLFLARAHLQQALTAYLELDKK